MPKRILLSLIAVAMAVISVAVSPGVSGADPVILGAALPTGPAGGGLSTGWAITSISGGISLEWFPNAAYDPTATATTSPKLVQGLLTVRKVFTDFAPKEIIFQDITNAVESENLGLRFSVNELITNNSPSAWTDYHLELRELDNPPVFVFGDTTGFHPDFPHFHSSTAGVSFTSDPLKLVAGLATGSKAFNFIDLGDGIVANGGGVLALGSIGIHDWEVVDKQRRFSLVEFPTVPEPSTWLLFGSGLAGFILWRKRAA
ncbi:MAG TPA: PEP-CTERM sorting domain-containing protein [Acidobacteriota bacterium]|jgi:hypothetical protein